MKPESLELKKRFTEISQKWITEGLPSQQVLESTAETIAQWKKTHQVSGIWPNRPLMVTATIDDGIGQGLQIINGYAQALGLEVHHLGLLQPPDTIIDCCRELRPDVLGLTILQLDSDDDLCKVGHNIPSNTCLIAGGPAFKFDSQMATRCNVHYVASNVAYFIDYLLKW